ncbi:MAG: response regulator transcription factor [Elusimicrobiaceae bacterium]|nr:response regulator transcription factor [Elusimicrobiaceae bacterium]
MINIILADDHALVRQGVRMMLETDKEEFRVIGEVSNGEELLEMAKKTPADVYIVDISMPVLNGTEAVHKLLKIDRKAKVLILSMYDDRVSVEKALKAGAKGFVVKVSRAEELLEAVREVAAGRFYFGGKISKFLVQGFLGKHAPKKRDAHLTAKEKEVLQLIAEGYSSKQIAKHFTLSLNTIHVHRNNIMRKLGIHKQAELVRYALKEGIAQL